jgi:hypothetical protein
MEKRENIFSVFFVNTRQHLKFIPIVILINHGEMCVAECFFLFFVKCTCGYIPSSPSSCYTSPWPSLADSMAANSSSPIQICFFAG